MKYILVVAMLFSSAFARAQSPREALFQNGSKLMRRELSADDFLNIAKNLREERPFSEEERAYLVDLTRKTSFDERLCPTENTGLCEASKTSPLDWEEAFPDRKFEMPESESETSGWSTAIAWGIGLALIFVAGSSALKGKELVIHRP